MTEYHDYNTPAEGEVNWHQPLNDNFRKIDADIEVRDVEGALGDYQPNEGAKFLATDTGRIYAGNGEEWETIPSGPNADLLSKGYIVGQVHGYKSVVDPTDSAYEDAAEAIQRANDEMLAEMGPGEFGYVHIPNRDPDGNRLVVSSTVRFGGTGDKTILPRGWGFIDNPGIDCRIDDGSPMFLVQGDLDAGRAVDCHGAEFGYFIADASGRDAEFLRLVNVNAFTLRNTHAQEFDTDNAGGVYVFDGRCFNSYINSTSYGQAFNECPNCDVYVMANELGDGTPGELKFGAGNTTYADPATPFNTAYKQTIDCSGMVFNGRVEGAGGPGMIYVTDGYLTMTCTELDRVEGDNTHKVYFSGKKLNVGTGVVSKTPNDTGGDVIHIDTAIQVRIADFQDDSTSPGHSVAVVNDGGGSNAWVVPYESSLRGTTNYPAAPWYAVRYSDGWQRYRKGTTTIAANDTTTLSNWAGNAGNEIKLTNLTVASEPDGDVEFQKVFGWRQASGDRGKQVVKIKETGGTSFDLGWEIHRRPN